MNDSVSIGSDEMLPVGAHVREEEEEDTSSMADCEDDDDDCLLIGGPSTMELSHEEIDRALAIKAAVEADPSLDNLSDYEYVQYALAHPASEERSVGTIVAEYVYAMQCFRREYRLTDSVEEGMHLFEQAAAQHPGFFLAVEYVSQSGNFIHIDDVAAFDPRKIVGWEERRKILGGMYYRYQGVCSTLQAIRSGVAIMVECMGANFSNFDAHVHEQFMVELFRCYPKRHKEVLFLNSPTVINVAHSLWKKYLSPNMKNAFRLGYQIEGMEGQRIDELFKTPSPEVAQQHMVQKMGRFLKLRYRNQKTFSLRAATPSNRINLMDTTPAASSFL
ncbi:expressed unknown protein [Seminavis robusta]|uniref:CRAL-TRIO domain-containing protein n=1 Tax=Seminavis robusta TaxID=568900 RepID=A0A9N8E6S1_9STRA|nr:expressed unknown protein [Seminavis robusta]|eukprot:Sro735_g194810.1 n/a (332) ;mRNA; f:7405-8400